MATLRKYPGDSGEPRENPFSDAAGKNPFADRDKAAVEATATPAPDNLYSSGAAGPAPHRVGEFETTLPHRGGTILTLGIAGVLGAGAFAFCWPLLAFNLLFALPAWLMGQADLRAMQAGAMDRDGRGLTLAGYILGIVGTIGTAILFVAIAWISYRLSGWW